MSGPIEVVVVDDQHWITRVVVGLVNVALRGLLIMLLVPVVLPVTLSYWESVAAGLLLGMVGYQDIRRLPRGGRRG